MPRNIEIKARVSSADELRRRAAEIATEGPFEISQDDTFFRCDAGRLKLRMLSGNEGELIFYRRSDEEGPKESFYLRVPTAEPAALRNLLAEAYGIVGRVRKQRTLFLSGRTRIHVDRVSGLGDYLELEVVLDDDESPDRAIAEADDLMDRLGIERSQLVSGAYVDLMPASR